MTPWTAANAAIYRALGEGAVYAPAAGDPINCTVIRREADPDPTADWNRTAIMSDALVLEVRASEVPSPAKGDEITVGGTVYTIISQPGHPAGDHDRALWLLECAS